MASIRAEYVAEILFQLKRADKLATFTEISRIAGFKPGVDGKNMKTCIVAIRKDWPHLEWWRAIADDYGMEGEGDQAQALQARGFEVKPGKRKGEVLLAEPEATLFFWEVEANLTTEES